MNVYMVFTMGFSPFNPESCHEDKQAAIDHANAIFARFDGYLGVTVIEAQLNVEEGGVNPIYIRKGTRNAG